MVLPRASSTSTERDSESAGGMSAHAVMASFDDPAQAVRAALAMQAGIASSAHGGEDLVLKVGVHAGPSVVVTLNDRLDYFGSTVNMAARLQGQSAGEDIVLSQAIAADPAVQEILTDVPTRAETVALKGFTEPVGFLRLLSTASNVERLAANT